MSIKFIDREFELKVLKERYRSDKAEFVVIYGRRRIGKTEIIKQFYQNKPHSYYLADKGNHKNQLKKLVSRTAKHFNERIPVIEDWEEFFKYLSEKSKKRVIFVIDEFPYLIKAYPPIISLFQKGWDEYLKNSKIFLILCGSSVSMMKRKVLHYKSPLYGRRTGQLKIEPLSFKDSIKFFPHLNLENQIIFFAVGGRIPFYLSELDEKKSLIENIEKNVIRKDKILFEEPEFLLREELREPTTYSKILESFASKAKKLKDISAGADIEIHKLTKYLKVLIELNYLEKICPTTIKKPKTKITLYKVKDIFFRFWYQFVYPFKSDIEGGSLDVFLDNFKKNFNSYIGRIFEEICREAVKKKFTFKKIGQWWGYYRDKDDKRKEIEIDICALNEQTKEILFGECKWQSQVNAYTTLNQLKEKTRYVNWNNEQRKEYYILFAKSFKEKIKEKNVFLFDLKDIKELFEK